MKAKRFYLSVFLILVTSVCFSASVPKPPKVIKVDCTKNESINEALTDTSSELILEINDICTEDVDIKRDNVTLRGTPELSPNPDGVAGANVAIQPGHAVIRVRNARNVNFSGIQVSDGDRHGIGVGASAPVTVDNCVFVNNDRAGVSTGLGGLVTVSNITVTGGEGVASFDGALLLCTNCTINASSLGAYSAAARLSISNSNITAPAALYTSGASSLGAFNSTINGLIEADENSLVTINGVNQIGNPEGYNLVWLDATIRAFGGSNMMGETYVEKFSNFLIEGNSFHNGDIYCSQVSDAFCCPTTVCGSFQASTINGTAYGCNSCDTGSSLSLQSESKKANQKKNPERQKRARPEF